MAVFDGCGRIRDCRLRGGQLNEAKNCTLPCRPSSIATHLNVESDAHIEFERHEDANKCITTMQGLILENTK